MNHTATTKQELRDRRHKRIRARIKGTAVRPRLAIFKSNKFVSAQIIDDEAGRTLFAAHGRQFPGALTSQAKAVGSDIASRAKDAGISAVVFDRAGYSYAGQVKALADAAREAGLTF